MDIHRDFIMRKVPQVTILSLKLISIPTNNRFDKAVRYIYDNKSW